MEQFQRLLQSLPKEKQQEFIRLSQRYNKGEISQEDFKLEAEDLGLSFNTQLRLPSNSQQQQKKNNTGEVDVTKLDLESMMDVTSYGGVDLKQEEFSLFEFNQKNQVDDQVFEDEPFLQTALLERMVESIG